MESIILELPSPTTWDAFIDSIQATNAMQALEKGRVLLFGTLRCSLSSDEQRFLNPECADRKSKNVSYDLGKDEIRGTSLQGGARQDLTAMMCRFATQARDFASRLLPGYAKHLELGRTSYRPVEIRGRPTSGTKDDSRLHVDAFASSPVQGRRILRLFANVNPLQQAREWQLGEPFEQFAPRLLPQIRLPWPGSAWLLRQLRVTKSRRTPYDHVMLGLHDRAKRDSDYQRTAPREEVNFPAGAVWMFFSDRVLHAAISGQYALEQTFYLPVEAMADQRDSPLRILENYYGRPLV